MYRPNPGFQERFERSQARVRLLLAGNQPLEDGTLVLMVDGSRRRLDEVKIGEKVFAYDRGYLKPSVVSAIPYMDVVECFRLEGDGWFVEATKNHEFLCERFYDEMVSVDKLEVGSRLVSYNGSKLVVKKTFSVGLKKVRCLTVDHPTHMFVLANGLVSSNSGKTHSAAVDHARLALGEHPFRKIKVPNVGFVITKKSFKEGIDKDIMPKLRQVVGSKDIVRVRNNTQGIANTVYWRGGSVSHLMSCEQADSEFEGSVGHHAWFDEPPRREVYVAVRRGLMKTGGSVVFSCTPLDEPWIYEELYLAGVEKKDPDIEVFEGATSENITIPAEELERFKKILTADEVEARFYGKFRHLSGRVFKEYKPEIHRIPSFDVPYHWPVWVGIDPHRNKPHAVVFLTVSPHGVKYVCNEIYVSCPIQTLGSLIQDIGNQYNVVNILIDTSAQESGWGKVSARSLLDQVGIRTKLAQKKNLKSSGIVLINQLFSDNKLYIMEHCVRTHRELVNQVYEKSRDGQKVLEVPQKKFDDASDALRYILIENPQHSGVPVPIEIPIRRVNVSKSIFG